MNRKLLMLSCILCFSSLSVASEILDDSELDDVSAKGFGNQHIVNSGPVNANQDNNHLSIVEHNKAHSSGSSSFHIEAAGSAISGGLNSASPTTPGNVNSTQINTVTCNNTPNNTVGKMVTTVENRNDINNAIQNNANGSVILTGNSDQNTNIIANVHAAASDGAIGKNLLNVNNAGNVNALQTNEQYSYNELIPTDNDPLNPYDEMFMEVTTDGTITDSIQRNAQASVIITDESQQNIEGFEAMIIAASSANLANNFADIDNPSTNTIDIDQVNDQLARNKMLLGTQNQFAEGAQYINNNDDILNSDQVNANLSGIGEHYGQQNAKQGLLLNAAASAANLGQNFADTIDSLNATVIVDQSNTQQACNYIDANPQQIVRNQGIAPPSPSIPHRRPRQINENTSFGQYDDFQQNVSSVVVINAAASATNDALNIVTGNVSALSQTNMQAAFNNTPTCPTCP